MDRSGGLPNMHSIALIFKKLSISGAVLVLSSFTLLATGGAAYADDQPPCTAPADSTYGNGVHHPTGSAAGTYTYSCDTGLWSNQYYSYNPVNNSYTATYARDYSYDCAGGQWYMTEYDFSAADGTYHKNRVVTGDPGLATGCPAPVTPPSSAGGGTTDTGTLGGGGATGNSVAGTGPGSSNGTSGTITLNGSTTNNNTLGMTNGITSGASTGNAFVTGNTTGGSAASGDAMSLANIANLLQSTSNVFGPGTTTFTANINGDVTGDFMFDPSAVMNTGPGSSNTTDNNLQVNTTNTNNTNAQINNTIDVGATSGDATVSGNTTGGDATSGNAQAIVNLMNLINSTVAAGQSFIGTININGNLNGDILLPQGVLDQLLASTGPGSNNVANANLTDNSTTTNNTTETIGNNITSSATSGNASVAGNTSAGSATSGNAGTNVTLLNLTGSNTIGKNDLLVFVNVLGKWVGMIMNAPAGTSAAELGGGITSTGPGSNNLANATLTDNSTTTNNANLAINNDVNVHANSGNATVTNNTTGGNARSGNANTAVNILNMTGSNLSLSNWFGILFINVFGMWNGSFGVNTSAGDPASNPSNNPVQTANQESMKAAFKQFASFVAHGSGGTGSSNTAPDTNSAVLGTATSVAKKVATTDTTLPTPDNAPHASYLLPIVGLGLAGAILVFSERGRIFGRKH